MISSYVRCSVLAALYAGITTTTRFPLYIASTPESRRLVRRRAPLWAMSEPDRGSAPDPGSSLAGARCPAPLLPPHDAHNASWGPRLAGAPCAPPLCASQLVQNSR